MDCAEEGTDFPGILQVLDLSILETYLIARFAHSAKDAYVVCKKTNFSMSFFVLSFRYWQVQKQEMFLRQSVREQKEWRRMSMSKRPHW